MHCRLSGLGKWYHLLTGKPPHKASARLLNTSRSSRRSFLERDSLIRQAQHVLVPMCESRSQQGTGKLTVKTIIFRFLVMMIPFPYSTRLTSSLVRCRSQEQAAHVHVIDHSISLYFLSPHDKKALVTNRRLQQSLACFPRRFPPSSSAFNPIASSRRQPAMNLRTHASLC